MKRSKGIQVRLLVMGMLLGFLAACAGNDGVRKNDTPQGPMTGPVTQPQGPVPPPPPTQAEAPQPVVITTASTPEARDEKSQLREMAIAGYASHKVAADVYA